MSDRRDFYYKQKVTEAELDAAFEGLEVADRNLVADQRFTGMIQGGVVVEHSPTPNLTVDVSGNAIGYDDAGQRVFFAAGANVDMSLDSNAVTTAVTGVGNEKWLTLYVQFKRLLSDPRVDGNSATVYFVRSESTEFFVLQGVEATIGLAVRPAIQTGKILLADVRLVNAQTQILNADISITRRQDQVVIAGTPNSIREGFFRAALATMLAALNSHITGGGAGTHLATAIDYGGGATWADGTTNPADDLEAVLDSIFTNLGSGDGAGKIAYNGGAAWADGETNPAGTVGATIDQIITDLAATTGDVKVGAPARGGGAFPLAAGSVGTQTVEIKAALDLLGPKTAYRTVAFYHGTTGITAIPDATFVTLVNQSVANVQTGDLLEVEVNYRAIAGADAVLHTEFYWLFDAAQQPATADVERRPAVTGNNHVAQISNKQVFTAGANGTVAVKFEANDASALGVSALVNRWTIRHIRPTG